MILPVNATKQPRMLKTFKISQDVMYFEILAPHIYEDRTLCNLSLVNSEMYALCKRLKQYWDDDGKKIAFAYLNKLISPLSPMQNAALANFYWRELTYSRYLPMCNIPPNLRKLEEIQKAFQNYLLPFFCITKPPNPPEIHFRTPYIVTADTKTSELEEQAVRFGEYFVRKIEKTFSSEKSSSKNCALIVQKVLSFVHGVLLDVQNGNGPPIFKWQHSFPKQCYLSVNVDISIKKSAFLKTKMIVKEHLHRLSKDDRLKVLNSFLKMDPELNVQKTLELLSLKLNVQEFYDILYGLASDFFYECQNIPSLFRLFLNNYPIFQIPLKDLRKLFFEIYYNYPKTLHSGFFDWKKLSNTEFLSLVLILFEIDRNIFKNCDAPFSDHIFTLSYVNFYNYPEQVNKEKRELLASLFLQIVTRSYQDFAKLFDNLQKSPENTHNIVEQFLQIKKYQKETYLFFFLSSIHCTKYYWSEEQIYEICHAIAEKYPHFLQYLPMDRLPQNKQKKIIQLVKIQLAKENFSKMFSLPKPMLEKEQLPSMITAYCSLLSGKELIHFFRNIFGETASLENIEKHIKHKKISLTSSQEEEIKKEFEKQKPY